MNKSTIRRQIFTHASHEQVYEPVDAVLVGSMEEAGFHVGHDQVIHVSLTPLGEKRKKTNAKRSIGSVKIFIRTS